MFVYNTHPETTIEDVAEIMAEAQINIFGNPEKKSHVDCWMASFHVRVVHEDYEKLKNPAIWPTGWKCRDFIRKRPFQQNNQAQNPEGSQPRQNGE